MRICDCDRDLAAGEKEPGESRWVLVGYVVVGIALLVAFIAVLVQLFTLPPLRSTQIDHRVREGLNWRCHDAIEQTVIDDTGEVVREHLIRMDCYEVNTYIR